MVERYALRYVTIDEVLKQYWYLIRYKIEHLNIIAVGVSNGVLSLVHHGGSVLVLVS